MWLVLSIATLAAVFAAEAPSTAPTTAPATAPTTQPQLKVWFDQLADRDPDVRERARISLMLTPRQQLPELRAIVQATRALQPSQAAELHDIVTHVYLAGEPYEPDPAGAGFLGVRWPRPNDRLWENPPGLIVETRIKGFSAYPVLRDGDVIVGLADVPDMQVIDPLAFAQMVRGRGKNATLRLMVLRGGHIEQVAIKLSPRPNWGETEVDAIQSERENRAEAYWEQNFAKLIGETMTSADR